MGTVKREPITDDRGIAGGAAPTALLDNEGKKARMKAAWKRRKDSAICDDWLDIAEGLVVLRTEALAAARTNRITCNKYRDHFSHLLQIHGLDEIDARTRGQLFWIAAHRDEVEARRERLTPAERAAWNHPSTIWRSLNKRGGKGNPKTGEPIEPPVVAAAPTALERTADEFEEEQEEVAWQRGLLLRARKSAGDARMGYWRLPELPDAGLVEDLRKTRDAWCGLFRFIEILHNCVTLEQVRKRQEFKGNSIEFQKMIEDDIAVMRSRIARLDAGPREHRTETGGNRT
jgi:hypothetical protein